MGNAAPILLIVEDDAALQDQLCGVLHDRFPVVLAEDRPSALNQLHRHRPAIVTLDLGLPPETRGTDEGFRLLAEILQTSPHTKVVVVTDAEEGDTAARAIAMGAYDYYRRPMEVDHLALTLERASRVSQLEQHSLVRNSQPSANMLAGIVACSPQMRVVCNTIERVGPTDVTTLLNGQSGTGKELLARALHDLSPRSIGPFVAINCAAIPESLLESELFGYERGAFTGATRRSIGRIQFADGGTLFLDEIGDLPGALQAKLLRFLQERVIERVGGRDSIPVDVRVVCATHRNLPQMIARGEFREDLYYRVGELTIRVPPLAERTGDAVVLARVLLKRFASELHRSVRGFTREALEAIERHDWPGNVRELENRLKRALILSESKLISARDLELASCETPLDFSLRRSREKAEHLAVVRALAHTNNNVSRAAALLGITRPTLYALLSRHGIRA